MWEEAEQVLLNGTSLEVSHDTLRDTTSSLDCHLHRLIYRVP